MLPGTEIAAALTALDAMQVDVIGLNCATGPVEMGEPLRHLAAHSRVPISCLPNAGLPSVVDGKMHYDLTADQLAEHLHRFVTEHGVRAIGGCCGRPPPTSPPSSSGARTPPRPLASRSSSRLPRPSTPPSGSSRTPRSWWSASAPTPRLKAVPRGHARGDWDTTVGMARDQIKEGSHVIDVCVDYTGADGVGDMTEVASRFATQSSAPSWSTQPKGPWPKPPSSGSAVGPS